MNFQIDHNLLHDTNNRISISQWNELIKAISKNRVDANQPKDAMYVGSEKIDRNAVNEKRYFCYDNYDRYGVPGLDFVIVSDKELGTLTVYNGSEEARAPVTFEQGMQIARNFFNEYGDQMAEEIVCEWVMDGNPSIF